MKQPDGKEDAEKVESSAVKQPETKQEMTSEVKPTGNITDEKDKALGENEKKGTEVVEKK